MTIRLAYLVSEQKAIIKSLNNEPALFLSPDEINNEEFHALLYNKELEETELFSFLTEAVRFTPVLEAGSVEITPDSFESLSAEKGNTLYQIMRDSWTLQNTISLLNELVDVANHLRGLWVGDRSAFFEELWFVMKRVLCPTSLQLIHNEVDPTSKESQKLKLKQVLIKGTRHPQPQDGTELESKLMENYQGYFNSVFELCEYSKERGEIVLTATVNKSPLLIMATLPGLTPLQSSLLTPLFDLLQRDALQ